MNVDQRDDGIISRNLQGRITAYMRNKTSVFLKALPPTMHCVLFVMVLGLFSVHEHLVYSNSQISAFFFDETGTSSNIVIFIASNTSLIAFAVLSGLYNVRGVSLLGKYCLLLCGVLMVAGSLLWACSSLIPWSFGLSVCALVLFTLGHICSLPLLVKSFAQVGLASTLFLFAVSRALVGILLIVFDVTTPEVFSLCIAVSPVVFIACLMRLDRAMVSKPLRKNVERKKVPIVLLITFFIIGFILQSFNLSVYEDVGTDHLVRTVALITTASVAIILAVFVRVDFNRMIYVVSIPLILLGMLLASFPGGEVQSLAMFLYYVGRSLIYAVAYALFAYLVRYSSFDYYWLSITTYIGLFIGHDAAFVMNYFSEATTYEFAHLELMSLVVFFVLLACIILYSKNNMKSGWGSIAPTDSVFTSNSIDLSCENIAAKCKLTQREVDVLKLLSRGRNCGTIASTLYIAEGTTKTHIKHVYQKLDVHSQQELIDFVEETQHNL